MPVNAVCPGSFDPVTNGHVDVIERAAPCFARLVVACLRNVGKDPLFDVGDRVELLSASTRHLANVEVATFDGLLVDFCREQSATVVVKGLRVAGDFEYEAQMAQMNRHLGGVETFFLSTSPVYSFLSSSLVKQVARFGGDVSDLVPPAVVQRLRATLD